jgi:hypothetical protein
MIPSHALHPLVRWPLVRCFAAALCLLVVVGVVASAEEEPKPPPGAEPPATPPAPVPAPGGLGTPLPPGGVPPRGSPERTAWRESMWAAPTAEDWQKPVLITFQRTWDDALAVAKETARPILVCINMDG